MKKKLLLDIDKLERPNKLAIGQAQGTQKDAEDMESQFEQLAKITMIEGPEVEGDEDNFIVDVNALRRWLQQNRVERSTEIRTTGELVFHKYNPVMTLSAKEREVLDTVSVNLKSSSKAQEIVDLIRELIGAEERPQTTWMAIARRLDITTRYKDCGAQPEYKNDGKTPKMNHQRLMEVDLMPVTIFHGTGKTRQEADDMASRCAMRYLQNLMETGKSKEHEKDDETEDDIVVVKVINANESESSKLKPQRTPVKTFVDGQTPRD